MAAPNSAKWFAIGFGNQMAGSLILVAWPWNNEVIVSTRLARYLRCSNTANLSGQALPDVYSGPGIQVLSSAVNSSSTSVEIQCSNCTEWSGGSIDLESASAGFIYAYGGITPVDPANPTSDFFIHAGYGNFDVNLQNARVSSNTSTSAIPQFTASTYRSPRQKVILQGFDLI